MRIGDLSTSTAKLKMAVDSLRNAWLDVQAEWDDPAARKFEDVFLDPLAPSCKTAMEAMNRLAMVFAEAERALAD
ncbi:MAG: hypothetical protein WD875_03175 [Pirellulales bacterium]